MTRTEQIQGLIAEELERALFKFPEPTNSSHEGYAVLLEEIEEMQDEFDLLMVQKDIVWRNVKSDNYTNQRIGLLEMRTTIQNLIKEAVQVGAMIEKWNESLIDKT